MKNFTLIILLSILCSVALHAQDTLFLRQKGNRPYITAFRSLRSSKFKTAVIVCSGGSYGRTADVEEGIPAAKLLAENGITAFLLDYTLPSGKDSIPLSDAQLAIRYVREHAADYGLDKNRIGIMGFSAGGHLVSTIGTHFKEDFGNAGSKTSFRPDFSVLVYPVISMADELTHKGSQRNFLGANPSESDKIRFSNELQVTDDTPPVFIVHAVDDDVVKVENSLLFSAALRQHNVPVETFIYAKGGHGFGVNNPSATVQWTDSCIKWIKKLYEK